MRSRDVEWPCSLQCVHHILRYALHIMVCMDVWSKAKKCLTLTSPHLTSTHRSHKSIHRGEIVMYPTHTCNPKVNTSQTCPLWGFGFGISPRVRTQFHNVCPPKGERPSPADAHIRVPVGRIT
jgi:hypothetical protein